MTTKRCPQCGEAKALTEFAKNKSTADGYFGYCKSCWAQRMRAYRANPKTRDATLAKRREAYNEGRNNRKADNRKRAATQAERKKRAEYALTEQGKRAKQVARKRYAEKNQQRLKANSAVSHAVRNGKLPHISTKRCALCGAQAVEYHHWSYLPEHHLDVTPLCKICHAKTYTKPIEKGQA